MMKRASPPTAKGIARRMTRWALVAGGLLFVCPVLQGQSPDKPAASDLPTITFRRVFEGSTPEFVEITVREDGAAKADVRQLSEAASPQEFVVGPALRGQIFDLVRQMRNFQGADLDAQRRVAYMGQKTFRWDQGAESYQTQYNYTVDLQAIQLQKMFENLAQEQTDLATLEQRLRYDRLGVNQALDQFEGHFNRGILAEPARFLPVLDRIAEDTRLIELARQRARSLAARIRVAQDR
jgi:hypothetical protein